MTEYGTPPREVLQRPVAGWDEMMHYLYMPVHMPGTADMRIAPNLDWAVPLLRAAWEDWFEHYAGKGWQYREDRPDPYVYLTARHGYATPDNPLNRPGWHCDGFGTDDINYVWWDCHSSRFALQEFSDIAPGHVDSMRDFEAQVKPEHVTRYSDQTLYALTPYVVHCTPEISPPGCMRRFLKISISEHRYNLIGNTHNYKFDYTWTMHPRGEARNDPVYGEADFVPEAEVDV
jgi:hypothetical protein